MENAPSQHAPDRAAPILSRPALVYTWLAATSVMCLLIADIVGVKLFQFHLPFSLPFFGDTIQHTAGMLTFPVTFLITDWLNDYYGKRARRVVLISFAMALGAFTVMQVARAMPHWDVPFNVNAAAFEGIFGSATIMYIASLCAYLVGSFADIFLFGVFKRITGGRMMWLRATGSTVLSQMIDSFVVTWLAFSVGRSLFASPGGPVAMTMGEVLRTAATGYTLKFCIALAITPLLYVGHGLIGRITGLKPLPAVPA